MTRTFDNKYECKLRTKDLVDLERYLGRNPLNELFGDDIPKLDTLLAVLYYSMRKEQPALKMGDIYDIFDTYMEEGGDYKSLSLFVSDLLKDSGLLGKSEDNEQKPEEEPKN